MHYSASTADEYACVMSGANRDNTARDLYGGSSELPDTCCSRPGNRHCPVTAGSVRWTYRLGCGYGRSTRVTVARLAFGKGVHFCIGSALAKLEAKAAVEALLTRTTGFGVIDSAPRVGCPACSCADTLRCHYRTGMNRPSVARSPRLETTTCTGGACAPPFTGTTCMLVDKSRLIGKLVMISARTACRTGHSVVPVHLSAAAGGA